MEKSETISRITKAILNVMADVKGIEKNMKISAGTNSYNGVADQEVKQIIGASMAKNGLALIPISIDEQTQLTEWDENYNGNVKHRQSIFAKVKTTYLLMHETGEYITVVGYGHGVDSQDKAAGKATTYALKYAMLYTFLVPTGKIDDADNTHSENIPVPQKQEDPKQTLKPKLTDANLDKLIERALAGEEGIFRKMEETFSITTEQVTKFKNAMINRK